MPAWIPLELLRLQTYVIVGSVAESLFTAEIAFGRLYTHMPEQKLDSFQLASGLMTKTSARSPQVMRSYAR
jgi:hypothetical protein